MQEAIQPTTLSEAADPLAAAAYRAETWAGEPFLYAGEDVEKALAPGTARRRALDDAIAEMDAGKARPSPQWKVHYGLMLGLERVLADPEPHTVAGTPLRRHQIDALAGMLTELIAANQKQAENGHPHLEEVEHDEEEDEPEELGEGEDVAELSPEQDPGAVRRYRFRHPTASGKTIAAAGFVEAARTEGVLILTHRRLLGAIRFGWLLVPRDAAFTRFSTRSQQRHATVAIFCCRFQAFRVKPVDQGILDFIGITHDVACIKTQNAIEVVDPDHVAVNHTRLDYMLPFTSQKLPIKNLFYCWRTNFQ